MKSIYKLLGLLAVLMLLSYACRKENLSKFDKKDEAEMKTSTLPYKGTNTFNSGGAFAGSRTASLTVLGNERVNPYTVEKMTEAWNLLYEPDIAAVPTTDVYVKFCPQDYEELAALIETELVLYDFPLEYEVIEMGDYYEDPSLGPEAIPCFYAIVKPGYTFPAVNYELIDLLHLARYDTHLTEKAFELTGNPYDGNPRTLCDPDDADYPQCLCTPLLGEDYPACLEDDYDWSWALPGGSEAEPFVNACGCAVYQNPGKPGGCIKVQDKVNDMDIDFDGVKNVKVILKDTWFTQDVVYTDENGCFKLNERYRNNVWMWIKFKNEHCRIRAKAQNAKLWQFLTTVKDYVGNLKNEYGQVYNNVEVNYYTSSNHNSQAHRYWGAATVLNAVEEFHDQALADGIFPPPYIDIFVAKSRGDGFAIMKKYIGVDGLSTAVGEGIHESDFFSSPFIEFLDEASSLGVGNLISIIGYAFPDVMIGSDNIYSDQLKVTAYHELAHASHFLNVGYNYWMDLIIAEVNADGWGDQFSDDAGRISVCESWAEHIGETYTHRKYPTTNDTSIGEMWEQLLERRVNVSANHVPIGLHHDLIDDVVDPPTRVTDQVSGFTIDQLYSSLNINTTNIDEYRQDIIDNHLNSTTNTQTQVDDLFNSY